MSEEEKLSYQELEKKARGRLTKIRQLERALGRSKMMEELILSLKGEHPKIDEFISENFREAWSQKNHKTIQVWKKS